MFHDNIRPRRLRASDGLRRMVRETRLSPESLIWPIFVAEGEGIYEEIPSLPGQYHYSLDQLYRMVERARAHGVSRVILFGLPRKKMRSARARGQRTASCSRASARSKNWRPRCTSSRM